MAVPIEIASPRPPTVQAALAHLPAGVEAGVVAEFGAGDTRGVVLWPALKDGGPLDDDLVGFVVRRGDDGTWRYVNSNFGLSHGQWDAFVSAIGAATPVTRTCGASPDDIAVLIPAHAAGFRSALAAGRGQEAMHHYEAITALFSLDVAVRDDFIPELLLKDAWVGSRWTCDTASCTWEGVAQLPLVPCGAGFVLTKP